MKKNLFSLCFALILSLDVFPQGNFGAVGTTWHYQIHNSLFNSDEPITVQSVGTATLAGVLCNEIVVNGNVCIGSYTNYVYESNDTVFIYLPSTNSFGVLYNFNAMQGDSVVITTNTQGLNSEFTMMVDSTGLTNINGFSRKIIYWHWNQNWLGNQPQEFYGPVIQGIGDFSFLFPLIAFCDPQPNGMRCYQDSVIGLYQTGLAVDCDTVIYVSTKEVTSSTFSFSPNPVNDQLIFKLPAGWQTGEISICNLTGDVLFNQPSFYGGDTKIDVSNLPRGVYLLSVRQQNSHIVKKVIKI